MKIPFVLGISGLAGLLLQAGAFAASDDAEATVAVHNVDFRGRPPFKRTIEYLPLSEVARLETATARETVIRTADFSGRPPFRRNLERVEIVDAARLELTDGVTGNAGGLSGGHPLKRHR